MFKSLKSRVVVLGLGLGAVAPAFATGPDYSSIASAVDATTIVAGITAIAAVMMLPRVAKWGYRQVMSFLR